MQCVLKNVQLHVLVVIVMDHVMMIAEQLAKKIVQDHVLKQR